MTADRLNPIPCWQARLRLTAREVEVELHGDEAAEAAAELAEHGIPGRPDFVYSPIRIIKFFERFRVWSYVVEICRAGASPFGFASTGPSAGRSHSPIRGMARPASPGRRGSGERGRRCGPTGPGRSRRLPSK